MTSQSSVLWLEGVFVRVRVKMRSSEEKGRGEGLGSRVVRW